MECPNCKSEMNQINKKTYDSEFQCPKCYLIVHDGRTYRLYCDEYHAHSFRCLREVVSDNNYWKPAP